MLQKLSTLFLFSLGLLLIESGLGDPLTPALTSKDNTLRVSSKDGTPLHWAAFEGSLSHVQKLLRNGADINAQLANGNTPLHLAAHQGRIATLKLLLTNGANPNLVNNLGYTPRFTAKLKHQRDAEKLLRRFTSNDHHSLDTVQTSNLKSIMFTNKKRGPLSASNLNLAPFGTMIPPPTKTKTLNKTPSIPEKISSPYWYVQLASLIDKTLAKSTWRHLKAKHPRLLRQQEVTIHTIKLKNQLYHRLLTGPLTRQDALSLCEEFNSQQQDCFVVALKK